MRRASQVTTEGKWHEKPSPRGCDVSRMKLAWGEILVVTNAAGTRVGVETYLNGKHYWSPLCVSHGQGKALAEMVRLGWVNPTEWCDECGRGLHELFAGMGHCNA